MVAKYPAFFLIITGLNKKIFSCMFVKNGTCIFHGQKIFYKSRFNNVKNRRFDEEVLNRARLRRKNLFTEISKYRSFEPLRDTF